MYNKLVNDLNSFAGVNPEFAAAARATPFGAVDVLNTPILATSEAAAAVRDSIVYGTDPSFYADFLVDLYRFYRAEGALGIEALRGMSGAEISTLVADGVLPSHEAYKKFNLLAFYASLRDENNVNWLLEQPKTNVRAEERVREVINGVTPEMRADAGVLLGQAMAIAYEEMIRLNPEIAGVNTAFPSPPTPPAPPVDETREALQTAEDLAIAEARYQLEQVVPLVTDVKLTALNELTLVLNQLTSLTEVYRTLETYFYQYNYYYHYERLERAWWYMLYVVDHIEQRDLVTYRIYTENTYKLMEYVYNYNDLINIQGLVSGVLGLEYAKALPEQVNGPVTGTVETAYNAAPEEVQVLLDFVVPFAFDITDELSLYYLEEIINNVINTVRNELHFFWEYHIRNYWYWDPLDESATPFANAILSNANQYLVTVAEDLDVGKVLNVLPITNMYREASIGLFAPADEYPLLDKAVFLDPAPVSFVPNQVATGPTANKLAEYVHIGPAANTADFRASTARFTDKLVGASDEQAANFMGMYNAMAEILGATYGNPTALYALIPEEVRINTPSVTVPSPSVTVPERVDTGLDAYQVVGWDSASLVSFVPQFAFAGVRTLPSLDAGKPILVNVNARGLGSPVTFEIDLNRAVLDETTAAANALSHGSAPATPGVTVPTPAPAAPLVNWGASTAGWIVATGTWAVDRVL